jgi:putative membrane protein
MWTMHDGMGWWMVFGGVWVILFWVALIALIVWVIRRIADRGHGDARGPEKLDALEIAKMRYARGEITKEQFDQLKRDLTTP